MGWVSAQYDESGNILAEVRCHSATLPSPDIEKGDKAGHVVFDIDDLPANYHMRGFRVNEVSKKLIPCRFDLVDSTTPRLDKEGDPLVVEGVAIMEKETVRVDEPVRATIDVPSKILKKNTKRKSLVDIS